MKIEVKAKDIIAFNKSDIDELVAIFPKYTSQIINLANQNAQGTRPKVVGQLSELFPEYEKQNSPISISTWREWYQTHYPKAIDEATDKIYSQIENLKDAILLIDKELVRTWVEDLVISKTFTGLYLQKVILDRVAKEKNATTYRLSTPEEESQGIDGYIDNQPYSIKPQSYKVKPMLQEEIAVSMIYYTKPKDAKGGLIIEFDE